MGWLWGGRGKPRGASRSRPRVARAIVEARAAQTGSATAWYAPDLGGAMAVMERAVWTHDLPPFTPALATPRGGWNGGWGGGGADATEGAYMADVAGPMGGASVYGGGQATPARARDFGQVGLLLERAEDTARRLGRSRAEMWEEALSAWLETQLSEDATGALAGAGSGASGLSAGMDAAHPAPRPWLFEARRQRVWGEIDETLGALRVGAA